MWNEHQLEVYTKQRLEAEHPTRAGKLWSQYVVNRTEVLEQILPFIISVEPDLTDHGATHIQNVIDNAARLLGLDISHIQDVSQQPGASLNSAELLLLITGCLLHDIGNIKGRANHNLAGAKVWRDTGTSYSLWDNVDRRTVITVCRAHTGKAEDGSDDTIGPLSAERIYFAGEHVRAAEIAAILRFADELAEGKQRTSAYLIKEQLVSTASAPYHQYAKCTRVQIDFVHRRIALTYEIDIADTYFSGRKGEREKKLKEFLLLIYSRIVKLEHERVFARHYAPNHIFFRETSVSILFVNDSVPLSYKLSPLILNDFNLRGERPGLDAVNPSYRVTDVAKTVIEESSTHE